MIAAAGRRVATRAILSSSASACCPVATQTRNITNQRRVAPHRRATSVVATAIKSSSSIAYNNSNTAAVSVRFYAALPQGVVEVRLPALSPTMETGTISSWKVKEGDKIAPGDVWCSVATDKANVDFESQEDGIVAKILIPEGTEDIPLGAVIALMAEDEAAAKRAQDYKPDAAAPATPAAAPAAEQPKSTTAAAAPAPAAAAPVFQQQAQITPAATGGRVIASPLARKLAEKNGVSLDALRGQGTGPNDRIIAADVQEFVKTGAKPAVAASAASTTTTAPAAARAVAPATGGDYVDIPVSSIRKVIAQRLQESKRNIPHYYLTVEIQLDEVMQLRQKLNKRSSEYKLSVNDFIVKAAALAMRKVPEVNSSWQDNFIRQYNNVDVSVAVQTDNGLITPIVFDAEKKGLSQISNDVKQLAAKAREGKLQPQEFQGGTFTVSNLGMFGVSEFSAIINPPQSCILAVGAAEKKVVPVEGASDAKNELPYKVVSVMKCTLSCDHRVVDGAVGAKWLAAFKENLEQPMLMLL